MEGLTFGEQVKIILKRKGMTIKQLAEVIEERTGKAMSRQNLTQRLGRDNFQEQDMRMIAAILDCPFHLSIFPDEMVQNAYSYGESTVKQSENPEQEQKIEIIEEEPQIIQAEERDMTIGELYAIHEELDELEKNLRLREEPEEEPEEPSEAVVAEEDHSVSEEESGEDVSGEEAEPSVLEENEESVRAEEAESLTAEEPENESMEEDSEPPFTANDVPVTAEEIFAMGQEETDTESPIEEISEEPEEKVPTRRERFFTGGIFSRRKNNSSEEKKEEKKEEKPSRRITREIVLPEREKKAFEPIVKPSDAEEDLTRGEVNPYTGHEYKSNSVRMHPSRIGYVQVYDRAQHKWTDMTEWAFLGYQERKKAVLGKDYEPPIYLD